MAQGSIYGRETTFTPTVADHVAAQRAWMLYFLKRPNVLAIGIAFLLLWGLVAALGASVGDRWPAALGLALFGVFAGLQLLHWMLVPRRVRRAVRQQPTLLTPSRCAWDGTGLEVTNEAGTSQIRWVDLHRWFEGAHGFVFLPQDYLLVILPRHAFSDAQAEDLRALLLTHACRSN